MNNDIAIRVENLSKQFRLGEAEVQSENFAGSIARAITKPLRNYRKYRSLYKFDDVTSDEQNPSNVLWALRDVNFDVPRGQVMGIVGTNGAGKSTLLKVLSRISPPSSGRIEIRGRVSSLLEVGTGFHPELTGRENVYLNGTVMGMRKREIDIKFDEIVEFSGVSKFLETPVKRYSSGMRVRLAFAVAAHLEPEILIIDEVLAVGDAAFQKKCLSKMEDVGHEGRTVLFVSHNMPAVTRLCSRAILLHEGTVVMDDTASTVVGAYLNEGSGIVAERSWDAQTAIGDHAVKLLKARVIDQQGQTADVVDVQDVVGIEMTYSATAEAGELLTYFSLWNHDGEKIFTAVDTDTSTMGKVRQCGTYTTTGWIPKNLLNEGTCYVSLAGKSLNPNERRFVSEQSIAFQVVDKREGLTAKGSWVGGLAGAVRPLLSWQTERQAH